MHEEGVGVEIPVVDIALAFMPRARLLWAWIFEWFLWGRGRRIIDGKLCGNIGVTEVVIIGKGIQYLGNPRSFTLSHIGCALSLHAAEMSANCSMIDAVSCGYFPDAGCPIFSSFYLCQQQFARRKLSRQGLNRKSRTHEITFPLLFRRSEARAFTPWPPGYSDLRRWRRSGDLFGLAVSVVLELIGAGRLETAQIHALL